MTQTGPGDTAHPQRVRGVHALVWGLLFAAALAALVHGIGSVPLIDPDEGRNAEVAREMMARRDFVVPHLAGLPYLDKPVLFFAATAVSIGVLGETELAARIPPLLFTLAAAVLTFVFGRRVLGPEPARLAALALLTSPLVFGFARIVIFDSAMLLWVGLSFVAFYRAWETEGARWPALAWAAAGMAVLTKGPVGLVLPLLTNVAFALICRRPLRRLFHPAGLAAFAVVVLPWFLAVLARHPEFAHYAFVRETLERVATDKMRRTGPIWYFVPLVLGGGLPWTLLVLAAPGTLTAAWRERRGSGSGLVYIALWVLVPLVFFSLSQSKRPGYILPSFPAVALLCAHAFTSADAVAWRAGRLYAVVVAVAALVLLAGGGRIAGAVPDPAISSAIDACALPLGIACATIAAIAIWATHQRRRAPLLVALAALPIAAGFTAPQFIEAVGQHRSARSLASAIRAAAPDGARVVGIEIFPASLPYYLRGEVLLDSPRGTELRSNYIAEYVESMRERPGSPLRPSGWWRSALDACSSPTVFLVQQSYTITRDELAEQLPLLFESRDLLAFGPCRAKRAGEA